MKTKTIPILFCALLAIVSVAYARNIRWIPTEKPPVSLVEALEIAQAELGKEIPKKDWFCLRASLAKTFSSGDWELEFSTKEGVRMSISVGSDKSVRKSSHGFSYE